MDIKYSFADKYDCSLARYTKPHITLINFIQWEMQETKLINRLKNIIENLTPFSVKIDGFASFPTHTIYFNIQTKNDIVEMLKSLRPIQSLMTLSKKNKPHFITEPHLALARKLQPWQYEKGWLEYSNTNFVASFMVNKVMLLKREVETKKYFIAASFLLASKASTGLTQASLFA